ncbi:hypothetical protein SLS62_010423 [Diatrype stigma]|uniref:Uncharacterized protein n=1 Tax=Diatrype stigma TaxID=117547 RepID=A0AAN9YHB0_9PEZI
MEALRQLAASIPGLNNLLGLASVRETDRTPSPYIGGGSRAVSIQLRSKRQPRAVYLQSRAPKRNSGIRSRMSISGIGGGRKAVFGMTSRAEGMERLGEHPSTDGIFPHGSDTSGAIRVTHEFEREVETNTEGRTSNAGAGGSSEDYDVIRPSASSRGGDTNRAESSPLDSWPVTHSNWSGR